MTTLDAVNLDGVVDEQYDGGFEANFEEAEVRPIASLSRPVESELTFRFPLIAKKNRAIECVCLVLIRAAGSVNGMRAHQGC